jgi:hypothetical protein
VRLFRPLARQARIELLPFAGEAVVQEVQRIWSVDGAEASAARQDSVVWIPCPAGAKQFNVIRVAEEFGCN